MILTAKFNAFFAGMYITCGLETLTQPGGKMRLTMNYLPLKSTTARSANVTAKSNRFTSGATTWKIPKQRAIFSAPLRSSRQLLLPYGTRDPMTQAWGHTCFLYADVDEGTSAMDLVPDVYRPKIDRYATVKWFWVVDPGAPGIIL